MNIGKMRKRVQLLQRDSADDGRGGYIEAYVPFGKPVWAEFLKPRFRETETLGGAPVVITQGLRMRYKTGVDASFHVRHGAAEYEVLHVDATTEPGAMVLTLKDTDFSK